MVYQYAKVKLLIFINLLRDTRPARFCDLAQVFAAEAAHGFAEAGLNPIECATRSPRRISRDSDDNNARYASGSA